MALFLAEAEADVLSEVFLLRVGVAGSTLLGVFFFEFSVDLLEHGFDRFVGVPFDWVLYCFLGLGDTSAASFEDRLTIKLPKNLVNLTSDVLVEALGLASFLVPLTLLALFGLPLLLFGAVLDLATGSLSFVECVR